MSPQDQGELGAGLAWPGTGTRGQLPSPQRPAGLRELTPAASTLHGGLLQDLTLVTFPKLCCQIHRLCGPVGDPGTLQGFPCFSELVLLSRKEGTGVRRVSFLQFWPQGWVTLGEGTQSCPHSGMSTHGPAGHPLFLWTLVQSSGAPQVPA